MAPARRAAVVTSVAVLAGGALVAALPGSLPRVRLAGVALLWWYWALAIPAVAVCAALAIAAGRRAGPGAADALSGRDLVPWASPALLTTLAALVFSGAPAAPLVAIAALAAPLAGRLLADAQPLTRIGQGALVAAALLALCAELVVAGDLATALGFGRLEGVAAAALLAALAVVAPGAARLREGGLVLGALGVALPVVLVAVAAATTPWMAWNHVASRPSIAFDEKSAPVTRGVVARVPATMRVGESQLVTTLDDGVFRVRERDGGSSVLREWRLAAGESLPLRAGDELSLSAGSRVRFEAGRRVPGAPASGAAWADPRGVSPLSAIAAFAGIAITLAGACAALPARRPRSGAVAVAAGAGLVLVAAAVCWGVYAALAGPELGIGSPPVGTLVRAAALAPASSGFRLVLLVAGLAALLVAVASALHSRAVVALGPRDAAGNDGVSRRARLGAIGVVLLVALAAAFRPADGWRLLTLGAGLAATAVMAPRLVGAGRARTASTVAGIVAFAALVLASAFVRDPAPVLAEYPALAAAPLAWAVGWLLDRDGGRRAMPAEAAPTA